MPNQRENCRTSPKIAGMGLSAACILNGKTHRENPTKKPVSRPNVKPMLNLRVISFLTVSILTLTHSR